MVKWVPKLVISDKVLVEMVELEEVLVELVLQLEEMAQVLVKSEEALVELVLQLVESAQVLVELVGSE